MDDSLQSPGATYVGDLNAAGYRHGVGTLTFHSGDVLSAVWHNGVLFGVGTFTSPRGQRMVCRFLNGSPTGRGVSFSADGESAWELHNGVCGQEISLAEARQLASHLGCTGRREETPPRLPSATAVRKVTNVAHAARKLQLSSPAPSSKGN